MASTLPRPQCVNPFHAKVNPWCIEFFSINMDKYLHFIAIITQGQFWPLSIVVAWIWVCVCPCLSVCVCVNHELVRMIIHDSFKLGSPNLDQRCKPPWLWSLLFCRAIDLDLQGQIYLKLNFMQFQAEFVCTVTHHPYKLGSPNLDQECKTTWLRSLLFWRVISRPLPGPECFTVSTLCMYTDLSSWE